jgi:hypothetical protein
MKPAIDRLEHWLEVMSDAHGYIEDSDKERQFRPATDQARLALAEVRAELESRSKRATELHGHGESFRQLVGLCEHGSVCEVGFWQAGNRRWFAQVKLMSGDELEPRSGETPEEAVRNAVEMIEQRETAAAEDA